MNKEIKIIVTFRRTSRLSMRIAKDGNVHVSAPISLSKEEVKRFVNDHQEWIENARKRTLEAETRRKSFYAQLPLSKKTEKTAAMVRLDRTIQPLLEYHCQKMNVRPSRISYKAMISRWGMCNTNTKEICFSLYLLLLPEWCIEHVVVHELAHLLVPNHGPQFYVLMDQFFPMWKEAKRETTRISRS